MKHERGRDGTCEDVQETREKDMMHVVLLLISMMGVYVALWCCAECPHFQYPWVRVSQKKTKKKKQSRTMNQTTESHHITSHDIT